MKIQDYFYIEFGLGHDQRRFAGVALNRFDKLRNVEKS